MADVFLSYSTDDHIKTQRLVEALTREGWQVFWDRNIPVGKSWDIIIEEELPKAKAITSLWSRSSVRSDWVRTESNYGYKHKKLLPAMIEKAEVPISFSLTEYADLTTWDGVSPNHDGLQKLVSALKLKAGDPSGGKPTVLDERLPELLAEIEMYDGQRAAHSTMGTRARARSRAAASRYQSEGDAPASRDGRASLRDAKDAHGRNPLSDEAPAESRNRDGPARARL
jgi:TIR domain